MARTTRLGSKVRALRRRQELTQAQLAKKLNISASYLNLIEHNRRPLTAPLLIRLAQLFEVDLQTFSEDEAAQVASDLLEVFGDPLFDSFELTNVDIRELSSANPQAARAVVALYRAYRQARQSALTLATTVDDHDQAPAVGRVQLPSEEVNDVFQRHMNHFPRLEDAAQALRDRAGLSSTPDVFDALIRDLRHHHGVQVEVRRARAMAGATRRYDPEDRVVSLSEVLRPSGRNFQLAHMAALLNYSKELDQIVAQEPLSSDASRSLCRVALANYFAGAVVMPYDPFLKAAQEERYDIELLRHRFKASFEQVCHRLTTLQRPGNRGVPLHLIRIDIAGNISKRFSASGLRFARFSASCPLWNVHATFHTPGHMRVQLSRMQGGDTYLCVARTVRRGGGGYHAPEALQALSIGCEIREARALVYSDGIDLESQDRVVNVGVTCQLCEQANCAQRTMPPIHHPLRIEENVRGVSFFAPLKPSPLP
jgi:predicted transcriptional regulator/transcriptional regulator with XRE-family HTH domain